MYDRSVHPSHSSANGSLDRPYRYDVDATGLMQWPPGNGDLGKHSVTLRATNSLGSADLTVPVEIVAAYGDPISVRLVASPAHGSVTLAKDGSFVYTPSTGFSGADSFTYVANDGQTDSRVAKANINVKAARRSGSDRCPRRRQNGNRQHDRPGSRSSREGTRQREP